MKFKLTTQTALACLLCLAPACAQSPAPSVAAPPPPVAPEPPQVLVEIAQATPAVPPVPPAPAALPALAQAEAAEAQAEEAEAQTEDVFKQVPSADPTVIFGGNRHTTPLLIDSGEIKEPKQRGALIEDLNVMHRILAKAVSSVAGGARQPTAMGIAVFAGGQPGPDTLYISGFGPVFLLDVKFPLLGPPRDEAEKPAEAKPKDSTWEETKRELYGPPQPPAGGMSEMMLRRYGLGRGTPSREPLAFDAGRVEALKAALLKALKNAGNIHELKPDDTLVAVVRGGPSGKQTRTWQAWRAANFAADSGPHLATAPVIETNINFAVNAAGTTEHSRKQIEIEAAKLQLEKAERDYKRAQELVNSKSIPQETFDDTKTTFELAKNTVEQKLKELHLIEYQRISDDPLRGDMPKIMTGYVTANAVPTSTLTIRVKAADISAFAGDKLSLDEFTKKADIAIY